MMEEKTNDDTDETEQNEEIDYDELQMQVSQLHNQLDRIKATGENIGNQLSSVVRNNPERTEEQQRLMRQAYLLYERVEKGDRSIVRGE